MRLLKVTRAISLSILLSACAPHRRALNAPPITDDMVSDQPAVITARLRCTLTTRDRAVLIVRLLHFADRESCIHDRPRVIDEKRLSITRGTHLAEESLAWSGDRDGAVSLEAVLQTEDPQYVFLTRRFGTEYCLQVQ